MKIEDFARIVKDSVIKQLGSDWQVTVKRTNKNNSVTYTGLKIRKSDSDISPLIYLDNQYKNYQCGKTTVPEVVNYVVKIATKEMQQIDMKQFLDFNSIADNIIYKLINTERNRALLEDLPHIYFLDLSIVFQYMLVGGNYGTAFILIHNAHIRMWEVTVEDLIKAAKLNTPQLMGYEFSDMKNVLNEIIEIKSSKKICSNISISEIENGIPMYVLSNRYKTEGAACILYPKLLSKIGNNLKSSYYIIPSSIHEVLILPARNTDSSMEIQAMIREINDTLVAAEEILSYSLYFYEEDDGRMYIV